MPNSWRHPLCCQIYQCTRIRKDGRGGNVKILTDIVHPTQFSKVSRRKQLQAQKLPPDGAKNDL